MKRKLTSVAVANGEPDLTSALGSAARADRYAPIEIAAAPQVARAVIERLRPRIEREIGCSVEDALVLQLPLEAARIAARLTDSGRAFPGGVNQEIDRLRALVSDARYPPSYLPMLTLREKQVSSSAGQSSVYGTYQPYHLACRDCVVSLRLRDLELSVIAMQLVYRIGDTDEDLDLLIFPRHAATEVLKLLAFVTERDRLPKIKTLHGETRYLEEFAWDQLTLAPEIREQLVQDFDLFFEERSWYQQMRIPHRRGYLLHGPPGNGKSSVVKAMLNSRGLTAYQIRLFDKHTDDSTIEELFTRAATNGPSLVLLEDIDRVFPKSGHSRTGISLQALLNCLDGVGSGTGIVTVATANEPALLDSAILRRPGRFDRVVHFANPDAALREQYFRSMHSSLGELDQLIERTRGYSYAQLREIFIMGALNARSRGQELSETQLLFAADVLRQGNKVSGRLRDTAGFGPPGLQVVADKQKCEVQQSPLE